MNKGEERVGLEFNPSGLPEITQMKQNCADLINQLDRLGEVNKLDGETLRLVSLAQTKFEEGCMFAVKALVRGIGHGKPNDSLTPAEAARVQ